MIFGIGLLNSYFYFTIITLVLLGGITITSSYAQTSDIPDWVKSTAGWWSNDEVEDAEFFQLIEFLIDRSIITIPNNQDDSQRVQELENKLSNLKSQTVMDVQNAFDDGYSDGYADRPSTPDQIIETREQHHDHGISIVVDNGEHNNTFRLNDVLDTEVFVGQDDLYDGLVITYLVFDNSDAGYNRGGNLISIGQFIVDDTGRGVTQLHLRDNNEFYHIGHPYEIKVQHGIYETSFYFDIIQ